MKKPAICRGNMRGPKRIPLDGPLDIPYCVRCNQQRFWDCTSPGRVIATQTRRAVTSQQRPGRSPRFTTRWRSTGTSTRIGQRGQTVRGLVFEHPAGIGNPGGRIEGGFRAAPRARRALNRSAAAIRVDVVRSVGRVKGTDWRSSEGAPTRPRRLQQPTRSLFLTAKRHNSLRVSTGELR